MCIIILKLNGGNIRINRIPKYPVVDTRYLLIFMHPVCLSVRLSICPYPEKRNYPSFVNISPTLVIDTSMERSSRVLHHVHGKCVFDKLKVAKARKISSVKRHFPGLFIGVAQQCSSGARCPPWQQHLYLLPPNKFYQVSYYPVVPGEKVSAVMFVNNFQLMLCTLIGAIILSINIQVGLNVHLYDDIGDASSSLRGSTSSFKCFCEFHDLLVPILVIMILHVLCYQPMPGSGLRYPVSCPLYRLCQLASFLQMNGTYFSLTSTLTFMTIMLHILFILVFCKDYFITGRANMIFCAVGLR